tara:strand:+ start:1370 stop:1579 length:210 start_codon:yes stop_codon:yes gene_type:complete
MINEALRLQVIWKVTTEFIDEVEIDPNAPGWKNIIKEQILQKIQDNPADYTLEDSDIEIIRTVEVDEND